MSKALSLECWLRRSFVLTGIAYMRASLMEHLLTEHLLCTLWQSTSWQQTALNEQPKPEDPKVHTEAGTDKDKTYDMGCVSCCRSSMNLLCEVSLQTSDDGMSPMCLRASVWLACTKTILAI
jgi:hypothetical protein